MHLSVSNLAENADQSLLGEACVRWWQGEAAQKSACFSGKLKCKNCVIFSISEQSNGQQYQPWFYGQKLACLIPGVSPEREKTSRVTEMRQSVVLMGFHFQDGVCSPAPFSSN